MKPVDDIWIIYCPVEEEEKRAEKIGVDYECTSCGKVYDPENVSAYNPAIVEQYRQEYNATKRNEIDPEEDYRERDIDFIRDEYKDNS